MITLQEAGQMLRLETERMVLREFKRTDWKDVHEYATDPEVVRYMEWGPNSVDDTMRFVDSVLDAQREKPRRVFEFAATLKESGNLIGACGIRLLHFDIEQAEIGYCYNSKYWGKGFGSEACKRLMRYGFDELKLHRVYAACDTENAGSAAVLQKCGMRREGHFVQDKKVKGSWRDTFLFAMLKSEWIQKGQI